jgi:hypothetical protein
MTSVTRLATRRHARMPCKLGRVIGLSAAAALPFAAVSCSILGPSQSISIRTDRTQYVLESGEHRDEIQVTVRITNNWGQPVYLHRKCGYGEFPSRHLIGVSGDSTRLFISGSGDVCISLPLKDPIPIAVGHTYEDTLLLRALKGTTGGFYRISYDIQLSSVAEGWGPAEPVIAREAATSNTFEVMPPQAED